jgi:hypothetical protein
VDDQLANAVDGSAKCALDYLYGGRRVNQDDYSCCYFKFADHGFAKNSWGAQSAAHCALASRRTDAGRANGAVRDTALCEEEYSGGMNAVAVRLKEDRQALRAAAAGEENAPQKQNARTASKAGPGWEATVAKRAPQNASARLLAGAGSGLRLAASEENDDDLPPPSTWSGVRRSSGGEGGATAEDVVAPATTGAKSGLRLREVGRGFLSQLDVDHEKIVDAARFERSTGDAASAPAPTADDAAEPRRQGAVGEIGAFSTTGDQHVEDQVAGRALPAALALPKVVGGQPRMTHEQRWAATVEAGKADWDTL